MHLTSVTLRGFKSFADRTRLELDRGLVAIVGPNGSGKSNLIDALMWALGTQGTRALRAERMEDVIFTGTVGRQALGMSQVVLSFDNSTGAFPLEFSEVQIGRTLFRDGASEYSLNGTACRLLDVQELLSEAGIGREMHVVVAQGQVEEIVQARPEELRSFVEEASGISKHRRRKERAMRKIEQVEQDIARAADLAAELRRQLRPLQAQVDRAAAHTEMTARLRETLIRLAVAELEELDTERRRAVQARETAAAQIVELRARREELAAERTDVDAGLEEIRTSAAKLRKSLDSLRASQSSAWRAVVVLRERVNARPDVRRREAAAAKLDMLATEETSVRTALDGISGRIDERESRLAELREKQNELRDQMQGLTQRRVGLREELMTAEVEGRSAEQASVTARAEGRAASERYERASERIGRLEHQMSLVSEDIERLDAEGGRAGMTVERFEAERRQAQEGLDEAERKLRSIESESAVLGGRLESLKVARDLARANRQSAETFLTAHGDELGARGVLGDMIKVASGLETAVEVILGSAVDALVVPGAQLADAVAQAESEQHDLLVAPTVAAGAPAVGVPGTRPLAEAVDVPGFLRGTIDALLDGVYLVDRWEDATSLALQFPHATFVTAAGRVLRARGLSRPAASKQQGVLGIAAALERTQESITRLDAERSRYTTTRDLRRRELERLDAELDQARSMLHEVEGRIAAAADRLREIGAEQHAANLERDLAHEERAQRLTRAEEQDSRRAQLEARAGALRAEELEITERLSELEVRQATQTTEEASLDAALTELLTEQASLTERLRGIERSRDELREEERQAQLTPADPDDVVGAEEVLSGVESLVSQVNDQVRRLQEAQERQEAELHRISSEASRTEVSIAALEPRAASGAETLARLDARIEEVGSRLAREHEVPPSRARREFPPDTPVETLRSEQLRLEAELRRLGPVNPLAADEITTLEERKTFLEAQLEDLRRSRRDLLKLVRATEEKMRELLQVAVRDADVRFREVASLLFPEGDGRLRLVSDDDPLEGRLEIEVRLGRKGHRRLSFLSGGEKALAGLGFLFALHLARPTPFLVLDEVDAPLDDANLGRFLRLLDSLRHQTQVLVVTHQKRTMERADLLVGVTLGADGTSQLLMQKLHEHATAT